MQSNLDDPTISAWRLLNRRRTYGVVAGVFFLVSLVGIPMVYFGEFKAAAFCSGLCLVLALACLWARHMDTPENFARRVEKARSQSPESRYVVHIADDHIQVDQPNGSSETVRWEELSSVRIVTNDTGPWGADFWYVLAGRNITCSVPLGATHDDELLKRLQQLPDWRGDQAIEALGSTQNQEFLCWVRDECV